MALSGAELALRSGEGDLHLALALPFGIGIGGIALAKAAPVHSDRLRSGVTGETSRCDARGALLFLSGCCAKVKDIGPVA